MKPKLNMKTWWFLLLIFNVIIFSVHKPHSFSQVLIIFWIPNFQCGFRLLGPTVYLHWYDTANVHNTVMIYANMLKKTVFNPKTWCLLCSLIDVNECDNNPCSQECANIYGSYQCYCRTGYYLKEDGHTCEGEVFSMSSRWEIDNY